MIFGKPPLFLLFVTMQMMFASFLSSKGSVRLVRAFTTTQHTASTITTRRVVAGSGSAVISNLNANQQHRFKSSAGLKASVEEDLDQALSSFLKSEKKIEKKIELADVPPKREQAAHLDPVKLSDLLDATEDEEVDYNDPKFLNVKNPFWVEKGLDPRIIDVLSEKGITQFTPVQAEAFLPVMKRRDVIGRSRTGTGKTLAFGLPTMTRLVTHLEEKGIRTKSGQMQRGRPVSMIVLCPTRELARQVSEELSLAAQPLGLFVDVFHGGVSYGPQAGALRQGLDILVGTPGRIIDHLDRGNLDLKSCDVVVLDEADEMLNMGFADDVELILEGVGSNNDKKTQCLLFSATTPSWVKQIASKYQNDVYSIDATGNEGARVATTVTHKAIQLPTGAEAKKQALEDIIAVEISRNMDEDSESEDEDYANPIAAAAKAKKKKTGQAMQQKIFGKTIVFTQTKKEADELVSGAIFKTLSAQAIHGDVGQKQRDATLNAFRKGAFNVLVATDVAARGIDISDVDLVIQFDPPKDVDTYVHRSGRTGRAGQKGVSVLLFGRQQARDIVRIERDLGHGFKFELVGPPSIDAAMRAAAKTSANACATIPDETADYFRSAASELLEDADAEDIVARCLAAISRRSTDIQSRSLITGELGLASVEMSYTIDKIVSPGDVMFTVGKLARMSAGELKFDSDVGKIQTQADDGTAIFDLGVEDAKRLVKFCKQEGVDTMGAEFNLVDELEVTRDRYFGQSPRRGSDGRGGGGYRGGGGGGGYRGGGGGGGYRGGGGSSGGYRGSSGGGGGYQGGGGRFQSRDGGAAGGGGRFQSRDGGAAGGGGYRGRDNNSYRGGRDESNRGWANQEERRGGGGAGGGGGYSRDSAPPKRFDSAPRKRFDSAPGRTSRDGGGASGGW